MAAVEVRIGHDRLARHLVERNVLRRELRRGGDDDRMANALGVGECPLERLHRAERPADHRGEALDAQSLGEARLRFDPVFHRHHRKIGAPWFSRRGIDGRRPGGAEATAEVIGADDEKAPGVQRLSRADEVVPPADVVRIFGVVAGDMMRGVQRMADENGVGALGVELAIGLVRNVEGRKRRPALQSYRLAEMRGLGAHCADRGRRIRSVHCLFSGICFYDAALSRAGARKLTQIGASKL